jgi:catechol 2,3-dioxygenase-like lactoylglutathione lyase family enzyme
MRITTLILQTSKLHELTHFYATILALPVTLNGDSDITIKTGSTELVFKQVSAAGPFYHFAINIPANKIEEARNWLTGRVALTWIEQYKSDIADFVNWHARSVYFFDPAGNIIELIARFDLDNKTDEPFSPAQLLSVSEAGLVVKEEELEKITETLLQQYQLAYFDKQPPLPQFKAIGDDEGLFIIVPENRNWFPTAIPSGIFPMEIQFNNNGKKYILNV